ncbi:DUF1376 domain-containing protein [Bartonella vinsonii]|uniref:DUF1376 domain-containing protein n=1 Tax=Bartonella vinsonii TaxID=33047 RepID=UPI00034B4D7F
MSSKLPWVRNFYQEWIMDFAGTDAAEKATYSTLTALMYRACEPIYDDTSALARIVGCSVQIFKKSLEKLIRKKINSSIRRWKFVEYTSRRRIKKL